MTSRTVSADAALGWADFPQRTSVEEAELVVEGPQHRPVARSVVGTDGGLKVVAPHSWTARAHLVGNQLEHAWNTREAESGGASDARLCTVGAGLTSLRRRLLQTAPGNQVGDLVVLRG